MSNLHLFRTKADERIKELELALKQIERKAARICMNDSCASGLHWNKRNPERASKTNDALKFIELIWNLPAKRICLENPVGCINSRLSFMPKPQYIQPYDFGEDASKKTGLWLRNLPQLMPTKRVQGRIVDGKERWANQTDSGQNKLAPSENRWKERSRTYQGIANAMASQWGSLL